MKGKTRSASHPELSGKRPDSVPEETTSPARVTTFLQVKGKVVREVRFSHDYPNNVLVIPFKDRTVLYFDITPEALSLRLEVQAHYIGENRRARKSWDGLAEEKH